MAHVFGICNSSPSVVLDLFKAKKIINSYKDVKIVPVGESFAEDYEPTKILFLLTPSDLLRNTKVLNSERFEEATVVAFGSPIRLSEYDGITHLDLIEDASSIGFGFHLSHKIDLNKYKAELKKKHVQVSRNSRKHLTVLTDSAKKGSLLTPLMTLLYTLPNSTLQTPAKITVAKILFKDLPSSSLDKVLGEISEYKFSAQAKERLVEVLDSGPGKLYRAAFKEYRKIKKEKGSVSIPPLAKKMGVQEYEIKYILAVLNEEK